MAKLFNTGPGDALFIEYTEELPGFGCTTGTIHFRADANTRVETIEKTRDALLQAGNSDMTLQLFSGDTIQTRMQDDPNTGRQITGYSYAVTFKLHAGHDIGRVLERLRLADFAGDASQWREVGHRAVAASGRPAPYSGR